MEELSGRTALLTGAAGGLGGFIARDLAAAGVNLALCDLPGAQLDDLIAELEPRGVRVSVVPADLTETDAIEDLARRAERALGPIDILVNNAGLEFAKGFCEQTREELEAITSVNLLGLMELTRLVLPGMFARRPGHVVNVASVVCPVFITRVGMYGRLEGYLPSPPPELATMPPEAMGAAVIRGIRENRAEVLVARPLTRLGALLYAAAPGAFARLAASGRVREFADHFARARRLY
jgi:NAD(P)-dependent dehydrogenase (short-subunit alcohol dehydrogenase family)